MFGGEIYYASVPVKTKGFIMGISKRIPWQLTNSIIDKEERYVILQGHQHLSDTNIVLAGLCNPNGNQKFGMT